MFNNNFVAIDIHLILLALLCNLHVLFLGRLVCKATRVASWFKPCTDFLDLSSTERSTTFYSKDPVLINILYSTKHINHHFGHHHG